MIVDEIKSKVQELAEPMEFVYGNGSEVNLMLDNLKADAWYFIYFTPDDSTDNKDISNGLHTTFPLVCYVVKKIDSPTMDYKSLQIQSVIDRARDLGRQFIHKLDNSSLIDTTTNGIESARYIPQYGYSDTHLFGVLINADVPIYEGKTGCL